jgi:hypothetical protein
MGNPPKQQNRQIRGLTALKCCAFEILLRCSAAPGLVPYALPPEMPRGIWKEREHDYFTRYPGRAQLPPER